VGFHGGSIYRQLRGQLAAVLLQLPERSPPVLVHVADAYGTDRQVVLHGTGEITVDTRHSGGWYDIALGTPSDTSFSYQLAGRLESGDRLTSDPQLGRS
jgi:hypothetical protein